MDVATVSPVPAADDDVSSARLLDRQALADDVRALSVVRGWRSVAALLTQYAVMAAAIGAAVWSQAWPVYVIAAIVVGSRMHACGVLMHEAAHFRLLRNRFLNDTVGDVLCAFPIGVSTSVYRHYHFLHHRYVNTAEDPDIQKVAGDEEWSWPKTQWECFKIFARDLLGLSLRTALFFMWFWSSWRWMRRRPGTPALSMRERVTFVLFWAALATGLTLLHAWFYFLVLWVIPAFTVLTAIFRIRNLSEHYGVGSTHELNESRNVYPTWWERLLIAPCHVNFHLDHHLFPSVPWYNLPRLHRLLLGQPAYAANAHLTRSYTGLRRGLLAEVLAASAPMPRGLVAHAAPATRAA